MEHIAALFFHLIHRIRQAACGQGAKITWLPTPSRVKRGSVQGDCPGCSINGSYDPIKFLEVRIRLIEKFGHREIITESCLRLVLD
jgi:hypothetical protein